MTSLNRVPEGFLNDEGTRMLLEHSNKPILSHAVHTCNSDFCTLHDRSNHPMRSFPQVWVDKEGLMKRRCTHGILHVDPDEYALLKNPKKVAHECDDCCKNSYPPELVKFVIVMSPPSKPAIGDTWICPTVPGGLTIIKVWNGREWVPVGTESA